MTIDGTTSTDAPPAAFDAATVRAWMGHAVEKFGSARDEIDRLNVFPVPDGDTGTNLYLTIESAAEAVVALPESADASTACEALARGALLGARGNSGVITSQILRGFADGVAACGDGCGGAEIARGLELAAESAYRAVAVPKEGTILSVVRGAAEGAAGAAGTAANSLADVACAALAAAQEALARTPDQLPVLREAGVVDAGGRGLVVLLEALNLAITGVEVPRHAGGGGGGGRGVTPVAHAPMVGYDGPEYEVMYLLDTEQDEAVAGLRSQLNELGDSVVVVGGRGLWNIHVHTDDIGAAIERAVEIGRPHRIKVTRLLEAESLRSQGRGAPSTRAVVVVAHGPDMADYLEEAGVTVVRAPARGRASTGELLAGISAAHAQEVVLLPSDRDTKPVAEAAAAAAREHGIRAAVVPTRAIVQSLAAVAVHSPEARFDDDVIAMGRAAGATRYAAVTIAAKAARAGHLTCEPGDVLGLVDGDIVLVGDDVVEIAAALVERIVRRGTELLTVVVGAEATDDQVDALVSRATSARDDLEVEVLPGGQPNWPFIIGAE